MSDRLTEQELAEMAAAYRCAVPEGYSHGDVLRLLAEVERLRQERDRLLVLVAKIWDICDWVPPLLIERIFRNWKASDERALADVVTRGRALVEEAERVRD